MGSLVSLESLESLKIPGLVNFRLCTLSDKELAKKVSEKLFDMYEKGTVPSRNIPARPDEDFDLLVGELIYRFLNSK